MLIDASGQQLMSVMGCMSNTKLFFWLGDGGETYSVHSAERGSNLLDFDTYIYRLKLNTVSCYLKLLRVIHLPPDSHLSLGNLQK